MAPEIGPAPASAAGRGPGSARDIGALFRRHGDAYRRSHALGAMERRALRDISVCRTGALGGRRDVCACGHERVAFNSCRNRHCPKCQALRQARWVAARTARALPVRHFHVVFTLPAELRPLVRHHSVALLDLLFAAASSTILDLASDPERLGALVGLTGVVHTWGRNLSYHPHVHFIVTAGGLTPGGQWVDSAERYLLPVKVMGQLFRGRFLDGLSRLFAGGRLAARPRAPADVAALADATAFARLKDRLFRKPWLVYAKAPFASPTALFRYLGLYTHRVAVSNRRLLSVDQRGVVFRTRGDKICTLPPLEFIRRFLQHVLPRGFVKIRHFGLLAPGNINRKLASARHALDPRATAKDHARDTEPEIVTEDWRALLRRLTGIDRGVCPDCGGALRSEPLVDAPTTARAPPEQPP
jgi:hypothetical protein